MKATCNEDGAEVAENVDDAALQPDLLIERGHRLEATVDLVCGGRPHVHGVEGSHQNKGR